jgi:hypothetical protein
LGFIGVIGVIGVIYGWLIKNETQPPEQSQAAETDIEPEV